MSPINWLLDQFQAPGEPGRWVLASLLFAVVGANLAWLGAHGRLGESARLLCGRRPWASLFAWSSLVITGLWLPWDALRAGALSPYFMGLAELEWVQALGAGGALAALTLAVGAFGWLVFRRSLDRSRAQSRSFVAPLLAAVWQWHWGFYRAASIGWLMTARGTEMLQRPGDTTSLLLANPLYWGCWIGLGLSLGELALNPFVWRDLRTPGRLESVVRLVAMAISSTALFALVRNIWICMAMHMLLELGVSVLFPAPLQLQPASES